jgi:hypothetical protein
MVSHDVSLLDDAIKFVSEREVKDDRYCDLSHQNDPETNPAKIGKRTHAAIKSSRLAHQASTHIHL